MDNESYYDEFADWYERDRHRGYHRMLDDLEVETVKRYGAGTDVLEAGCGTGLILHRTAEFARSAVGIDLSSGMLKRARERGLDVVQGSITELPFADESFDLVYSFKVLAHIEDIKTAMSEMFRVLRPGGYVLAEFYNRRSMRYLVKRLKPPSKISSSTDDEAVYTRYDTLDDIESYLPANAELEDRRGIRIVTPVSQVHDIPVVGGLVRRIETQLADQPMTRDLGGFLIAILRKHG